MKAALSLRRSAGVLLDMVAVVEKAISEQPALREECPGYSESMRQEADELEAAALLLESMVLAAQAPVQPAEAVIPASQHAVMQQALDALQTLHSMQAEWHAAFPEHVGDKEAPAMQAASSAIAALSATMEKPYDNAS